MIEFIDHEYSNIFKSQKKKQDKKNEIPRKIVKNRNSLPGPDHLKEAQIRVCLWLMTLECVKF